MLFFKTLTQEEEGSDSETLKDILHLPENLLHNDIVNTIMNESADRIKSENLMSGNFYFNIIHVFMV